jgi:hypothetical protein
MFFYSSVHVGYNLNQKLNKYVAINMLFWLIIFLSFTRLIMRFWLVPQAFPSNYAFNISNLFDVLLILLITLFSQL